MVFNDKLYMKFEKKNTCPVEENLVIRLDRCLERKKKNNFVFSDLINSKVVDESLSTTTTRVLFQRETTYVLQEKSILFTLGGCGDLERRVEN